MPIARVHRIAAAAPDDVSGIEVAVSAGRLSPAGVRAVFGKTEGNGCVNDFSRGFASHVLRGRRHTMLDDSDISATRHARAFVGCALAGLIGHAELYVSGGAEHQGPEGGGPVAVIARMGDARSNS
jgi:cyanuric acid amidohydrolase